MNKETPKRSPFLENARVRLVLAVLCALVLWMIVTMYVQTGTSVMLNDVPVNFTYNSSRFTTQGLSIVNSPSYTVTLKLQGDGSIIGDLHAEDFVVYPDYSSVKAAGATSLRLKAECTADDARNISVSITNLKTVDVVFDTVSQKNVPVVVQPSGLSLADGYVLYNSAAAPGEVTVTGPTGELEKIKQAVARVTEKSELSENITLESELVFCDENGSDVQLNYTSCDTSVVDVTLNVYKQAELPIVIGYTNMPAGFDTSILKCQLSQATLRVAGPAAVIDGLAEVSVGTLDLSTFALDKVYDLPLTLPNGIVSQENVSTISVNFDTAGLAVKTFNLPAESVEVVNLPTSYRLSVVSTRIMNVTLCGPEEVLNGLTAQGVVARINADDIAITTGQQNIAVSVYVPSSNRVFATGTYSVQCQIESNG